MSLRYEPASEPLHITAKYLPDLSSPVLHLRVDAVSCATRSLGVEVWGFQGEGFHGQGFQGQGFQGQGFQGQGFRVTDVRSSG